MPLLPGNNPDVISHNIKELVLAGHPENVAVAAAYANTRRHGNGEKHIAKAKRPSLPAGHPFNSHRAPDNRRRT